MGKGMEPSDTRPLLQIEDRYIATNGGHEIACCGELDDITGGKPVTPVLGGTRNHAA
jgi:hypothetical protein